MNGGGGGGGGGEGEGAALNNVRIPLLFCKSV